MQTYLQRIATLLQFAAYPHDEATVVLVEHVMRVNRGTLDSLTIGEFSLEVFASVRELLSEPSVAELIARGEGLATPPWVVAPTPRL